MAKPEKSTSARARKAGDDSYNARRRYLRSAERNLKAAEKSSGATAARYRAIAKAELENALETYDPSNKQAYSKKISLIANDLNVDLSEVRRSQVTRLQDGKYVPESVDTLRKRQKKAISESEAALASHDEEAIRERNARILLSDDTIGRRIMAGFVDVWYEKAMDFVTGKLDRSKILPAIFEFLKVDNIADMLEKLERAIGNALYSRGENGDMYETVKLTIQSKIADNSLVE